MQEQIAIEPPDKDKEGKTLVRLIMNEYTDESGILIDGKMLPGIAGVEVKTFAVIHLINGSDINLNFNQQIHNVKMYLDDFQLMTLTVSALRADRK